MKVLHIAGGVLSGGAARGTYWLHQGLLNLGIESRMIIQKTSGSDPFVEPVVKNIRGTVLRLFRVFLDMLPVLLYRKRKDVFFSTGMSGFDIRKTAVYKEADIIHLHWINNGMINIKLLKKIDKHIVWTMRDMWPFTGGCHIAMDCKSYEICCGRCPHLNSKNRYDLSWYVLKRKKRYFPKNMKIVAMSQWQAECARSSDVFREFDIRVIQNNINTEDFFIVDSNVARSMLGLPRERKIVLVSALASEEMKHQGFNKLQDACCYLEKDYLFVFFGRIDRGLLNSMNMEYETLGYLNDNISLRLAYSAADVFLAPYIQTAFGKTLAEAMACGTPVVAFDATGPRDIVDHKINGYLAKPFEPEDLANGIKWVLEDEPRRKVLAQRAREKAEQEFASEKAAGRYVQLYDEILARNH